jgi:predicted transcriptional regulator
MHDVENAGAIKRSELLYFTVAVTSAYARRNRFPVAALDELIDGVSGAFNKLRASNRADKKLPAVNPLKSVFPDYIVCLEDGRRLMMLKKYLRDRYHLTPAEYRLRWGLSGDYPMTAPNYSAKRSSMAKQMGLGTTRRSRSRPTTPGNQPLE